MSQSSMAPTPMMNKVLQKGPKPPTSRYSNANTNCQRSIQHNPTEMSNSGIQCRDASMKSCNDTSAKYKRSWIRPSSTFCTVQTMVTKLADGDVKRQIDSMIKVAAVAKDNNAQIQAKTLIQAKLLERDKHLDKIMNVAIQKTKEVEEKNEKIRKQHVDKIKQNNYEHILQHQINKDLQETKFQLENDKHQEIYDRMKQEDLNVVKEKMKKKQRLGEEMRQIIKEKMEAKERSKEAEKLADMKIVSQGMENLKQLSKRAAPNPKLIELSKKQDLVFAKLEAHNKQKDFKLKEQELSLKRAEETKERELIMKQKDLAEKRAHSNAMLRACLSAQVLFKSQLKKTQADQERAKDKRYIKADQEEFIKMKKKKLNEENLRNLDILKQQMMNRQLLANARCRKQSEEAKQFIEREQESLMHLNEYKEKVLMDARASGVPEEQLIVFNRNATSLIKKENHCLNLSRGNHEVTRNILRPTYFPTSNLTSLDGRLDGRSGTRRK